MPFFNDSAPVEPLVPSTKTELLKKKISELETLIRELNRTIQKKKKKREKI